MIFNDIDVWRQSLSKCHLNEAVMPTIRGRLVENVECYNRIQQILDTPEMEHCHKFLYNLDVEDLSEDEIEKVNELYDLGTSRGFITPPDDEEDCPPDVDASIDAPVDEPAPATVQPPPMPAVKKCAYTVMYSAMKGGQIKTGEAYSNSISPRSAKADVLAKLAQLGYDNVSILAIEAGDPDEIGMDEPDDTNANAFVPTPQDVDVNANPILGAEEDVDEDDMLHGRVHNGHVAEDDEEVAEDDILKGRKHNGHVDEGDDDKEDDKSDGDEEADDAEDSADGDDDDSEDADTEDSDGEEDDEKDDGEDSKDDGEEDDDADGEDAEGDDDDDEDELDDGKKASLRDSYKKVFKAAMTKCKFETAFDELSLQQKVDLFTELSKTWKDKPDPSKFMSTKEMEQLNKTKFKK